MGFSRYLVMAGYIVVVIGSLAFYFLIGVSAMLIFWGGLALGYFQAVIIERVVWEE